MTLAACVPTVEMRESPRLSLVGEEYCRAVRSREPAELVDLFAEPVRGKLRAVLANEQLVLPPLTSSDVRPACGPGKQWYHGGSRFFVEIRLQDGSDRLDLWRGSMPRITNVIYGKPVVVEGRPAGDLETALSLLLEAE